MTFKMTSWTPKAVENMVMSGIQSRVDMAGKFVEDDARRRLDAIKNPDTKRDLNYRQYLSKYVLTHVTETEKRSVVTRIGMRIGKQGQTHHGFYIERGSSTAPAQPYLRPALVQNVKDIVRIISG